MPTVIAVSACPFVSTSYRPAHTRPRRWDATAQTFVSSAFPRLVCHGAPGGFGFICCRSMFFVDETTFFFVDEPTKNAEGPPEREESVGKRGRRKGVRISNPSSRLGSGLPNIFCLVPVKCTCTLPSPNGSSSRQARRDEDRPTGPESHTVEENNRRRERAGGQQQCSST